MADKKIQAQKRLLKKLSALRKTLRKDEREALDRFILGASGEVRAHQFTDMEQQFELVGSVYAIAEGAAAEVEAHRFDLTATPIANSAEI